MDATRACRHSTCAVPPILNPTLDGGDERSVSCPSRCVPGTEPGTRRPGRWVGPEPVRASFCICYIRVSINLESRRRLVRHDAQKPRQHSAGGSRFLCHIYNRFRCNKFVWKLGPGRRCARCSSLLPSASDVTCKLKSVLSTQ